MCSPLECSGFPWQLLLTNGSHGFHGSSLGFAGVVSLPTPQTGHKSPHRAEFDFCLLTGTSQTGSPPSPAISRKVLGRRKIIPPLPLKNHSANFATPCKQFSNPLKKSPLLCLCGANFAPPLADPIVLNSRKFVHIKTEPGLFSRVQCVSPHSLVGMDNLAMSCSSL